jgi:hypothetical protein
VFPSSQASSALQDAFTLRSVATAGNLLIIGSQSETGSSRSTSLMD